MMLLIGSLDLGQNMVPVTIPIRLEQNPVQNIENNTPTYPENVNITLLNQFHFIPKIIPNTNFQGKTNRSVTIYNYIVRDTYDPTITTFQLLPPIQINYSVNDSVYFGAISKRYNTIVLSNLNQEQNYYLSYNAFIDDPEQNELYNNVLNGLRNYRYQNHLDNDEYLELIVRFVQSIPNKERNYSRFPVETLFEENGVCEDKSYLLAGLLEREGYDVGLFTFENKNSSLPGHMVVGVKSDGLHFNGTKYTLIETTMTDFPGANREYHYIGLTDNFDRSYKNPIFTKIGNGTKEYTKSNQVAYINQSINACFNYANAEGRTGNIDPLIQNTTSVCSLIKMVALDRESAVIWFNHHINPIRGIKYVFFGNASQSKMF